MPQVGVQQQSSAEQSASLARVETALATIPTAQILELLITQEKRKILTQMMASSGTGSSSHEYKDESERAEILEAHFFEPKQPSPFSFSELALHPIARISEKFIGDLPEQVKNLIFYFYNHKLCLSNRVDIYNRLLLYGKPGTGKSHLFKVLARELQVPSLAFSASFFADKYIGEASRKIRKAFAVAKNQNRPFLIFLDEIDALAATRTSSANTEHRGTLITLLTELQEIQNNKNIFVVAATNDLASLDAAARDRFSGSLSEIKELSIPQKTKFIMKLFTEKSLLTDNKLAERLAIVTSNNFSNRDLEYIVTTAKLMQFKDKSEFPEEDVKHLCAYLRRAIISTGKQCLFADRCPSSSWFGSLAPACPGI